MNKCMLEKVLLTLGVNSCKKDSIEKMDEACKIVNRMCKHFPGFPDINLIIALSGQVYEGKSCNSNMLFLNSFYSTYFLEYIIEYDEPICFNSDNIRFIRKLLESVNSDHCLVLKEVKQNNDGNYEYQAVGVIETKSAELLLAPRVTFLGQLKWKISIKQQDIYKYENGSYHTVNEGSFDEEYFESLLSTVFGSNISVELKRVFCNIVRIVTNLGHGTSMVIFESPGDYFIEIKRLTHKKSGHGIKLKNTLKFSEPNLYKKTETILREITQIDGGLVFDVNGNCDAIGCVFDGVLSESYDKGRNSRGSRYNSLALYIHTIDANALGIVISDDKSIDYIYKE